MKLLKSKFILIFFTIFNLSLLANTNYTKNIEVQTFIDEMAAKHQFDINYLNGLFSDVDKQMKALSIFLPPKNIKKKVKKKYPRHGSWSRYSKKLLQEKRAQKGVKYIKKYKTTFKKAYAKYGIPPEYLSAIIGIESYYGKNTGKFPVFDTLTTLAFEKNRRSKYFKYELEKFLIMVKTEDFDAKNIKGSYAGAIGLGQFMPSSFFNFAVDFNDDGTTSLHNPIDAIGSIAHYLKENGWKKNEPVAARAKYKGNRFKKLKTGYKTRYSKGYLKRKNIKPRTKFTYNKKISLIKLSKNSYDEVWLGAKNFYTITRYNHSSYYAMAVHQLAQKIKKELKKDTPQMYAMLMN